VWVTVAIAGLALWQIIVYSQMRDHTRKIERAYITMSHYPPGIKFGTDTQSGYDQWKREFEIRLKISNTGNTPATVTYALVQPIVAIEPLPAIPRYDDSFGEG